MLPIHTTPHTFTALPLQRLPPPTFSLLSPGGVSFEGRWVVEPTREDAAVSCGSNLDPVLPFVSKVKRMSSI